MALLCDSLADDESMLPAGSDSLVAVDADVDPPPDAELLAADRMDVAALAEEDGLSDVDPEPLVEPKGEADPLSEADADVEVDANALLDSTWVVIDSDVLAEDEPLAH